MRCCAKHGSGLLYQRLKHRAIACGEALSLEEYKLTSLRQSKLSASQLEELQRATHFDKKELQQWYKGLFLAFCNHTYPAY